MEEPELVMEDSTEGEETMETILEEPGAEASAMAFETELELAEEDFAPPDGDQFVIQVNSETKPPEGGSSEQLGILLENIITSSVQKSLEQAMPNVIDQIVQKIREDT